MVDSIIVLELKKKEVQIKDHKLFKIYLI